mmetsp:Transcript_29251/g.64488  ORF Transcript_29251/g.64488 Transcript_29251/m.64488 type:complete len:349 (+) Transcript_29251:586-1632(+)
MAFLVDLPASCRIDIFVFYLLSWTVTIARLLSRYLCRRASMEGVAADDKNATRCNTPCCTRASVHSPRTQNADFRLTSTASVAEENDDDNGLFSPVPPRPECPICMLTLPLPGNGATCMSCCGHILCSSCMHENVRVVQENNTRRMARYPDNPCMLRTRCPLCRETIPRTTEEELIRLRQKMESKKAYAFFLIGEKYQFGLDGLKKNERKAFEHYLCAADLGHVYAKLKVALSYLVGNSDVVEMDVEEATDYLVAAAKEGCVEARFLLGAIEHSTKEDKSLAYKHWGISASFGCDRSMNSIKRGFDEGLVTEDEYERVKRHHQKANDEMKSEERNKYFADKRDKEEQQ